MRERKRERNISRDVFTAYRRNNRARSNLRCNVTTCVGTCARFTKVAQYSSIRPPLPWAPRSPLAFLRGPSRGRTYGALVGPARFPFPISQIFLPASPLPPLPGRSFRPSNTIQISQPDFILVSRIFFIAPGPGGPHRARVHPPFSLSCPLPRLRTRAPYIINAGKRCICAKYKERRPTSGAPMFGALLIGQFTRCTFSYSTRSHGDIFTDRHKTSLFPLSGITYSMLAD